MTASHLACRRRKKGVTISNRCPLIDRLYMQYLDDEDSAGFIAAVSRHYLPSSLERLAECGQQISRRAAVLALGFVGRYESNSVLGQALHDSDILARLDTLQQSLDRQIEASETVVRNTLTLGELRAENPETK